MAYITNDGSRLIERARTEGKSIVFGSVRMNTIYKSDPYSLVQQTDEWFGENHGSVVGCRSHVSVNEVSEVCDSKLAVQCDDNSVSWKSLGIYAHLDGEVDELLFACESIENGEYKDVTIVELPVTLDGVVADFGISEGGSGGGGGGGEVPANMMTTDTFQNGLTGTKQWSWLNFVGAGTDVEPQDGDRRSSESFSINSIEEGGIHTPLVFESETSKYDSKSGHWWLASTRRLQITSGKVAFNDLSATWGDIIKAAKNNILTGQGTVQDDKGTLRVFGDAIQPDSIIKTDGLTYTLDSSGYLSSVYLNYGGGVATIGVIVKDAGGNMVENGRVSGVSMDEGTPFTFQSPIQLAAGYTITYQVIFSPLPVTP